MYLHLPSNSSAKVFPQNTPSCFKTQLPEALDLQGEWEVGLVEIQYPSSWYNVSVGELIRIGDETINIEEGYYSSFQDMFEEVNKKIKKPDNDVKVRFSLLPSKKVMISNRNNIPVTISKQLGEMLGYKHYYDPLTHLFHIVETAKSTYAADISQGRHHLYVYCNIVEPHIVGDVKVQLLRIVPVEKGDFITKIYENIQYFPVLVKKFQTIEINIKDDTGVPIHFNHGKTVLTLHFRKK